MSTETSSSLRLSKPNEKYPQTSLPTSESRFSLKSLSRSTRKKSRQSMQEIEITQLTRQQLPQKNNSQLDLLRNLPSTHQLRTRNVQRKRHSVFVDHLFEDASAGADAGAGANDVDKEYSHGSGTSTYPKSTQNYTSVRRMRSESSLIDYSDTQVGSTTVDSETMLIDMDLHSNLLPEDITLASNRSTESFQAASTVEGAPRDTNSSSPIRVNSAFTTASSTSADSTPSSIHPLRKMLITSPNLRHATSSPQQTPTRSRNISNPYPSTLAPTKLCIYKPDYSSLHTEVQHISECVFFGPSVMHPNTLPGPSQTQAKEVFDLQTTPSKHVSANCSPFMNISSGLVDPDLFSRNAKSIFSGPPSSLPSKHRTPLIFL